MMGIFLIFNKYIRVVKIVAVDFDYHLKTPTNRTPAKISRIEE